MFGPKVDEELKDVGGLLPKETTSAAWCRMWFRHAECWGPMRTFASPEMAACLPSWVSHRKGKCVDPFVASPNYVPYLAAVVKS